MIPVPAELVAIAAEIVRREWTEDDWAEHESDDEFQAVQLVGGFDATERAFCFSLYDREGNESWCQLSLDEISAVATGTLVTVNVRPSEGA